MKSYHHLFAGFFVGSVVLLLTSPQYNLPNLLPWLLGSILPDFDHPIRYCLKHKTVSFRKLTKLILNDYYINNPHFYPFHTIEFALFFVYFMRRRLPHYGYWLTAYLLHLFLDMLRHYQRKNGYTWLKKWSLVFVLKDL
jgi:hypothetical protein